MKKKKMRRKIARQLRRDYKIDFITACNMARFLVKGEFYFYEAMQVGGFYGEPKMASSCGRGCCFEEVGTIYIGRNSKQQLIQIDRCDLKRMLKSLKNSLQSGVVRI